MLKRLLQGGKKNIISDFNIVLDFYTEIFANTHCDHPQTLADRRFFAQLPAYFGQKAVCADGLLRTTELFHDVKSVK